MPLSVTLPFNVPSTDTKRLARTSIAIPDPVSIQNTYSPSAPAAPTIPTIAEQGLPGFEAATWYGLYAPKGTPQDIIIKLNSALVEALDDEGTRKRILDLGGEIPDRKARTPQSLADLVASETAKWSQIIKSNSADR